MSDLRKGGVAAINRAKTHCPSGHPYSPENTRLERRGSRRCKKCINIYRLKWCAKNKAGGRCVDCGKPRWRRSKRYCKQHFLYQKQRYSKRVRERQKKQLCIHCGKPRARKSKRYCEKHVTYHREANRKLYQQRTLSVGS